MQSQQLRTVFRLLVRFQKQVDGLFQQCIRAGHGGGAQGGGAAGAVGFRNGWERRSVLIHKVRVAAAVDMDIHEARHNIASVHIHPAGHPADRAR